MTEPLCPACKQGSLELSVSCCTDNNCCGGEHMISCEHCTITYFTQSEFDLIEEWIRLGGTKQDIEDAR